MARKATNASASIKLKMPNGHTRLKQALVLRDALAGELGIALESAMSALRGVEDNVGIGLALTDGRYRDALLAQNKSNRDHIAALDELIGSACARVSFRPRYAQYLALLLFAHWVHAVQEDRDAFLVRLNGRIEKRPHEGVTAFEAADLQLVAFWMATAAGKTDVLHACLALLENQRRWNRIIVITPSDALTLQHAEKLRQLATWSVFAYPQNGDAATLGRLSPDTIIVLDINKLSKNKQGDGVTLATRVFEGGANLVFVDEGHKGQKSEESVWKDIQQGLAGIGALSPADRGLLIEFSATFGQVVDAEHSFARYAKSVIFDYAYDRFHGDRYGKDFWHVRTNAGQLANAAAKRQTMTAALLSYWHQRTCYRSNEARQQAETEGLAIVSPLWVLLGLSVIGATKKDDDKAQTSDVIDVIGFLASIIDTPARLADDARDVLVAMRSLPDANAGILPMPVYEAIRREVATDEWAGRILTECFGWQSGDKFVLRLIKSAIGELGLGLLRGESVHYFGVVNVGDANGLAKELAEHQMTVADDAMRRSLFAELDAPASNLNVLIGSRRFAEGWDNYRASSLTLLRLGQGEGSLIIQMFGRVVRFAGIHGSGKRLATPTSALAPLQTAYVYGLKSDYLGAFLKALTDNGVTPTEPIICKTRRIPTPALRTVRTIPQPPEKFTVALKDTWHRGVDGGTLSLSASVATTRLTDAGMTVATGMMGNDLTDKFRRWVPLLDHDAIYLQMVEWRRERRLWNLEFDKESVSVALVNGRYAIEGLPAVMVVSNTDDLARLNRVAATVVRRLFERAYRRKQPAAMGLGGLPADPESYVKEMPKVQGVGTYG